MSRISTFVLEKGTGGKIDECLILSMNTFMPHSFGKNVQEQFIPGKILSLDGCQGQFQFGLSAFLGVCHSV